MPLDQNLVTYAYSEILGTAMLLYIGCNSCIFSFIRYDMEKSYCFGMAVAAGVQSFGRLSGAHMNPNITIANTILGHMKWPVACLYVVCQFLGALIGVGLFHLTIASTLTDMACITKREIHITQMQAFFYEFVITASLLLFCCAVWDDRNASSKDAVSLNFGMAYTQLTICANKQTGASMNFIRTLAPAIWEYNFTDIWIYVTAQLAASILVPLLWMTVFSAKKPSDDSANAPPSV